MTERKAHMQFAYRRSADQDRPTPAQHAVAIIGAGPVGLSLAIDLAQRGVASVLLDDSDRIGDGSRAICFAKRTLEIFDRLGVGEAALAKGVQWQKGRVFHRDAELYDFDLLPEAGHKMPAFINLQQYYVEGYLAERALQLDKIDLRWRNRVAGVQQRGDGVTLTIETPDGAYRLDAAYVVACDGARSPTRAMLGIDFKGEVFEDQFLIADVKMTAAFPTERWFWFDPPFHSGQSALLHKQPDDIWRIDLQLSPDADATHEQRPEIVRPRIEKMLGHKTFELEWVSVYRFQCRRIDQFVHDRVIFAGDAAHQVSPFGARGANSGIQDAENLAWKLAAVLDGDSPSSILQTYHLERSYAADENIRHSTRSTDFIAPHTEAERALRDAALALAPYADFAKRMVNSGRLSTATSYQDSPLSTPDIETWSGGPPPGAAMIDSSLLCDNREALFLSELVPAQFTVLLIDADTNFSVECSPASTDATSPFPLDGGRVGDGGGAQPARAVDTPHPYPSPARGEGRHTQAMERALAGHVSAVHRVSGTASAALVERYGADNTGATYLLRPDGYVAARWRGEMPRQSVLETAILRAKGIDV